MKKSYFKDRKCFICKGQATIYRFYEEGKYHFLCNSRDCELKSRIKLGLQIDTKVGE
jgi:hypothetical protein